MEPKVKIFIAEDDVFISEQLSDMLEELDYEVTGIGFNFDSSVRCLQEKKPDVAILDIKMHGEDQGFQIAGYLNEHLQIPFLFLTSFADQRTVKQAVAFNPAGYLVKPFIKEDIFTSLVLAVTRIQTQERFVDIKDGWSTVRIRVADMLWIKADDKYVEIHTPDKKYLERSSISDFLERIEDPTLIRTHRSYAVNTKRVDRIMQNELSIGKAIIPISRSYKEMVLKALKL